MLMFMFIGLLIGSTAFQIGIYRTLPLQVHFWKWDIPIRAFIQKRALLGLVLNFALSLSLMQFMGAGMVAGLANLVASIIFAGYMTAEIKLQERFPAFFNS